MPLSLDKIEALAPDQASLASARKLLKPSGWPTLAQDGQGLVWGECSGSGATPYRVAVNEADAGYKCTCPSRKFPCKHALALMWLRSDGAAPFADAAAPQWVGDWLGRRRAPSISNLAKDAAHGPLASIAALADEAEAETDPKIAVRAEAQRERNRAHREALIAEGLDALDRWLLDQIDRGLAGFDHHARADCATLARRLVDAKASGLANRVEQLPAVLFALPDSERGMVLAQELAMLHLIAAAYRRQDVLSPLLRADVRAALGWNLAREALHDDPDTLRASARWLVLASIDEVQPDKLRRIETWLARLGDDAGDAPGFAVLLDFVPVSSSAASGSFFAGEVVDATLAFYPSPAPLRALVAERRGGRGEAGVWSPASSLDAALTGYHAALAARPWLGDWPIAARDVQVCVASGRFYAVSDAASLPLAEVSSVAAATLLDAGPIALFGRWDGRRLHPHFAETALGRWIAA